MTEELSDTEQTVMSILAISGDITFKEFDSLCDTIGILDNQYSRLVILEVLREKGVLNEHALRKIGERYERFVCVNPKEGSIRLMDRTGGGIMKVDTHPLKT